jgi:hypothetical protein
LLENCGGVVVFHWGNLRMGLGNNGVGFVSLVVTVG